MSSEDKKNLQKITSRKKDYSQWYLDVVSSADLAIYSPVRGCMVIEPYGYSIWKNIQKTLGTMIEDAGVEDAYYPLFIPVSFLEQEETHAAGFAKEVAVVTHHRLVANDKGKLVPSETLEEPLIVRPTSETIMYWEFAKKIQSYRDLPYLRNQWCNIVRWEMRTKPFLRTMEFLWQEGHTAHATKEDAEKETSRALEMYRDFAENCLAIPVIPGYKSESEKFAGAEFTTTIEAMMQDGRALQSGTSHMLGQSFAKTFNVTFLDDKSNSQFVWQTSWGLSTRIIGAIIMTHSDDDGLVLPPKIAPIQAVVVPIWTTPEEKSQVLPKAEEITQELKNKGVKVKIDKREGRPGVKFFEWEKKGVPVHVEIGPKDISKGSAILARRDFPRGDKEKKTVVPFEKITSEVQALLEKIQKNLYDRALKFRKENTHIVDSWEEFIRYIPEITKNEAAQAETEYEKSDANIGGFLLAHWCGNAECEEKIKEKTKATIRCVPFDQPEERGKCVLCGKESKKRVIFAKAY